jgi:hypothetical protein
MASTGSRGCKKCRKLQRPAAQFYGNDAERDELGGYCGLAQAGAHHRKGAFGMRNRILAIAVIAGALSAPIAAQAQSETVGVARGSVIVDEDADGIAIDQRPAFHQYILRERVPEYTIPDRVVVGGVLPEAGVTYYDVPQTFGVTPYRYTVVNGQTILVEPRTRRIVQVVE